MIHLTLIENEMHDFQIPIKNLKQSGSVTSARFVQEWMTGSEAMPLFFESRVNMKIEEDSNGEISLIKIKTVDFGFLPIPSGISKVTCRK